MGSFYLAASFKNIGAKLQVCASLSNKERVSNKFIGKDIFKIDLPYIMFEPIFLSRKETICF